MSVEFIDFLPESNIIALNGKNKKQVIDELIDFAAKNKSINKKDLDKAIWDRENQLSTAIGHGIAVPHARIQGIDEPIVILGISSEEIADYTGIDKVPVSLVFLIISGDENHQLYLDILRSVSHSLFDDKELIKAIVRDKNDHKKVVELLKK